MQNTRPWCTAPPVMLAQPCPGHLFNQHPPALASRNSCMEARREASLRRAPRCGGSALGFRARQAGWRPQTDDPRPVFHPKRSITAWLQDNIVPSRARSSRVGAPAAGGRPIKGEAGLQTMACHQRTDLPPKKASPRREGACPRRWLVALGRPATKGPGLPPNGRLTRQARLSPLRSAKTGRPHLLTWREPNVGFAPTRLVQQGRFAS